MNVFIALKGVHFLILIENSPSARRIDPVGSLVPVAFGHDVCLMS